MARGLRRPRVRSTLAVSVLLVLLLPFSTAGDQLSPYTPEKFRGIYLSYWSAATPSRIEGVVKMARAGLINTVVIDIKDVTGHVAFDTRVPEVAEIGAKRVVLRDIDDLVRRLHEEGLYVIARMVVFSDPKLAAAKPAVGVHSAAKLEAAGNTLSVATLWRDRRKLAWIDPAAVEAWNYNIAIARDALSRGFDEINFDYIRFPSDGKLSDMRFPVWDGTTPRHKVIRAFYAYLREQLATATLSADLFGLSTVNRDALGIGQVIEDAFPYFDYVCPMVYPSHYAPGFIGKRNPAKYPYEVVHYSMKIAGERLAAMAAETDPRAKLRPWLQDFDLGADYTPEMVEAQIRAVRDGLSDQSVGFLLWSPRNVYHSESLRWARESSQR